MAAAYELEIRELFWQFKSMQYRCSITMEPVPFEIKHSPLFQEASHRHTLAGMPAVHAQNHHVKPGTLYRNSQSSCQCRYYVKYRREPLRPTVNTSPLLIEGRLKDRRHNACICHTSFHGDILVRIDAQNQPYFTAFCRNVFTCDLHFLLIYRFQKPLLGG